tara:strand:- start:212 stop:1030 length:819 start_codon:yes stop_codon:yes gene_type:complete
MERRMSKAASNALAKIESGHGRNWTQTKRWLLRAGIEPTLIDKAISAHPYGAEDFKLSVNDSQAFEQVKSLLAPTDRTSRARAAATGNTHATSVNGAMLAVWHSSPCESVNRIFKTGCAAPAPGRAHALIIENQECFLNKEDTYRFAADHCGLNHSIETVEFIYGAGNSICNKQITAYLKAFEGDVYCLFDIDAGGIRTYINLLSAGLAPQHTHFLVPKDIQARLTGSTRKASESQLQDLTQLYGKSPVTDTLITAIRHYKTTIEQESYRGS